MNTSGYEGLKYELTTGSRRSATTRHYRDEANRHVAVIRTAKHSQHGLIVTVAETYDRDYTTPSYTRSFKLVKVEGFFGVTKGWKVVEAGWDRNCGGADEDEWVTRQSKTVSTKAQAEAVALDAARRNVPLEGQEATE